MKMKKQGNAFLVVCSLLLIAACLLSVYSGVRGFNNCMEIKDYKTQEKEDGLAAIDTAIDGINQLKENEQTYLTGVGTYTAGLTSYAAGKQQLAKGAADLAAGEASYAAGQQQLAAGKETYAAGQKQLADNTDAYNEGKAKLALVTPIYNIAKATGVDPLGVVGQVEDGQAQLKQYEDGQQQLADAAVTIADGEAQLAQGKQTLLDGYATYNSGVDSLNAGAAQLASGKAKLSVFEQGMAQVAAGMETLMTTPAIIGHDGTTVEVESIASRLGDDFSYWALNDDGSIKTVNGCQYLNLDNCLKVCKAGQGFIADQGDSVTAELTGRIFLYLASFVICLLGAIAGIKGADAAYAPKHLEGTTFMGMLVAILGLGANGYGLIGGYTGYTYPLKDGTYSGTLQLASLLALAAAAILFAAVSYAALKKYKSQLASGAIAEDTPAAAGAGAIPAPAVSAAPVDDGGIATDVTESTVTAETAPAAGTGSRDKLHKLEREEEELKAMLASLTSKINDLKQQES